MNKEFERCCTFLAEMMEKYANVVMWDIITAIEYDPETSSNDAEGKKLRYLAYAKRFQEKTKKAA